MNNIKFCCPNCSVEHDQGFIDGVNTFHCLNCDYLGHGFHPDPEIDHVLLIEHEDNNTLNRQLGIPEVPLGVDPLSFGC